MRTVAEHLAACLDIAKAAPPLDVVLLDAVGCVLAEDVVAPFDLPVADLAGLDGYAVRSADVAQASADQPVTVDVVDTVRAGSTQWLTVVEGASVLIDSGAPLPYGADAVVPWTATDRGEVHVQIRKRVAPGDNVRKRAEDLAAGTAVLSQGTRIGARQVALLAAVGRHRVKVFPAPRVVIVSIGDELVEPGAPAKAGKVHDANGHALVTAVADAGGLPFRVAAVPDEHRALAETLEDQLVRADVIITTGGLSAGRGDTVKEVLASLGMVRFDNVAMVPSHQLGVGTLEDDTPVFCLPGEPVAAQISFETFVRPVLRQMAGWADLHRGSVPASVSMGWSSPMGLREFVPVRLTGSPGQGYQAVPTITPGHMLLSGLAASNAVAVVPEGVTSVLAGDVLHCLLLDQ